MDATALQLHKILDGELTEAITAHFHTLRGLLQDPSTPATLILGSGIGVSAGLPTWDGLIGRLLLAINGVRTVLPQPYEQLTRAHILSRDDALQKAANYLEGTDVLELAEYIRLALQSVSRNDERLDQALLKELVHEVLNQSPKLALPADGAVGLAVYEAARLANAYYRHGDSRKRSVLTFNYDNLLEYYVNQYAGAHIASPVYEEQPARDAALHVYHAHGYLELDKTRDLTKGPREESARIILTENSYYEMERHAYGWESFIVARALQDSRCLFVGFSGNDYNFRRIVKNTPPAPHRRGTEAPLHYMLVCIDRIVEKVTGGTKLAALGRLEKEQKQLLYTCMALKEQYWLHSSLHIQPIWTTHADLPVMLRQLQPAP